MSCQEILEDVDSLLQNPADKQVLGRLEEHFKACESCREELGDIINTASKINEVGQISDIIDLSNDFVDRTRQEAQKESDRFRLSGIQKARKKWTSLADYSLIILFAGTVIAALIIFYLIIKLVK